MGELGPLFHQGSKSAPEYMKWAKLVQMTFKLKSCYICMYACTFQLTILNTEELGKNHMIDIIERV